MVLNQGWDWGKWPLERMGDENSQSQPAVGDQADDMAACNTELLEMKGRNWAVEGMVGVVKGENDWENWMNLNHSC